MEIKKCVVSVAFRNPYDMFQRLQLRALNKFNTDIDLFMFTDEYPISATDKTNDSEYFKSSYYGFKPHAIRQAINKGYNHILWLDSALVPIKDISFAFEKIKEDGMLLNYAEGLAGDNCKQSVLDYFNVTKEELNSNGIYYAGGSMYGFDFTNDLTKKTFELWEQAEKDGCFGYGMDLINGHKTDEVCMSICQYKTGIKTKIYKELAQGNDSSLWLNLKENQNLWE